MTESNQTYTIEMSEEDMKTLVRNALMVAGKEMGEKGDHWPVIKNTIKDVMRDWEQLEIERAVHEEMKKHLYQQLAMMEEIMRTCSAEVQAEVAPRLTELREVYDAVFTDVVSKQLNLEDDELYFEEIEKPMHLKRAEAIIGTLEEEDA